MCKSIRFASCSILRQYFFYCWVILLVVMLCKNWTAEISYITTLVWVCLDDSCIIFTFSWVSLLFLISKILWAVAYKYWILALLFLFPLYYIVACLRFFYYNLYSFFAMTFKWKLLLPHANHISSIWSVLITEITYSIWWCVVGEEEEEEEREGENEHTLIMW